VRTQRQPIVKEEIVANVWIHTMKFEKSGDYKLGHKHNFSHAHLVGSGSVEVFEMKYEDGLQSGERSSIGTFKQGDVFLVPADKSHTVVALEDDTFAVCIQAVRDTETGDIVSVFCDGSDWEQPTETLL